MGNLPADNFSDFRHGVLFQAALPNYLKSKLIRFMTDSLVRKSFIAPMAKKKLSEKFEIGEELWPKIYMLSSKCAIDTGTRVFPYKILNNILCLNNHLYKMKVAESPLCSLCQKEKETLEHLFVDCTFSKNYGQI